MKEEERQKLIKDQRDKQRKAEQNEAKKMLEQSKRLDYITRALRLEELPVLEARYAKRLEEDRARHDAQYVESVEKGKVDHAAALLEKKRLARVQSHREKWEAGVLAARKAAYVKARADAEQQHKEEAIARKVARARRRREDYLDDLERARAEDEERAYEAAADALRAEEEREYEREMAERRAAEEAQRAADEGNEEGAAAHCKRSPAWPVPLPPHDWLLAAAAGSMQDSRPPSDGKASTTRIARPTTGTERSTRAFFIVRHRTLRGTILTVLYCGTSVQTRDKSRHL